MSILISQFILCFSVWYPHVCSLHWCFCFCFTNKFTCTIYLDSTYKWYHAVFDFTPLVAQMVKHLPTMQDTWVQSLGQEALLEKELATHSSTLFWKIPWTEEPGMLQSMGSPRVRHDWSTSLSFFLIYFPQYSNR